MFLTSLVLQAEEPGLWSLGGPLIWLDQKYGKLEVPTGFETDLASIPRVFTSLPFMGVDGLSRRPAVVHDWLYGSLKGRAHGKDFADDFLYDALREEGAPWHVAETYFMAVRLFGSHGWAADGKKAK